MFSGYIWQNDSKKSWICLCHDEHSSGCHGCHREIGWNGMFNITINPYFPSSWAVFWLSSLCWVTWLWYFIWKYNCELFSLQDFGGRILKVNFPQAPSREPRTSSYNNSPPRREGGGYNNPNKIFVGNLSWNVDDVTLETIFSDYGKVLDAKVISDRETGRSRGFGFVTLASADEVTEAINNLDGAVSLSSNFFTLVVSANSSCERGFCLERVWSL